MPRTFGANFTTEKNKKRTPAPFLTAIMRFGAAHGGDLALIGRSIRGIGFKQPVINSITHYAVVKDWGRLGSGFGSQADGTPDQAEVTVVCTNFLAIEGYRLSDRFIAEMETIPIDFFWNFIVSGTVYQEDGPSGSVHSPTTFGFRDVSLRITSLMDTYLQTSVLQEILQSDFQTAPEGSIGKLVPLAIGDTATNTNFDGARIPSIVVNTYQPSAPITAGVNTYALLACEAPPGGLTVTSLGSRYYLGHKIVEQDITIDASGTSADFPLFGTAPTTGGQDGVNEGFGNLGDSFFDINDDDHIKLGRIPFTASPPLGSLGYQIVTHPFRYDYPVSLQSLRMTATGSDAGALIAAPNTDGKYVDAFDIRTSPLRALGVKIVDPATAGQSGGGVITNPFVLTEPGAIGSQLHSITPDVPTQQYETASFDFTEDPIGVPIGHDNADINIPLFGWRPAVGHQYHLAFYVTGNAGTGVPIEPQAQWYNIKTSSPPSPGTYFGQPSFEGDSTAYGGERVFSPSFPGFTQQPLITTLDTPLSILFDAASYGGPGSTGSPEDGVEIGTTGVFQMTLEPEDARVIAAITLGVKPVLVAGAITPMELAGSLTVTINEVDRFGTVIGTLASAAFAAEDFQEIMNSSVFQDIHQFLSTPALLLAGHRYLLTFEGELDGDGKFSGWAIQGITNATFTGSGTTPRTTTLTGSNRFNPIASRQPVFANGTEPVHVRCKLHALKFDEAVELWPIGYAWTLRPYVLGNDKRFVLPDENAISCDANCSVSFPDAVVHALLNRAGVPDARIDLAGTFADSFAFYSAHTYLLRGAVVDQITYKALIARVAFEARSDFDWEFHKAQLKWLPMPGDVVSPAKTITLSDIPRLSATDPIPDFHVTRTETADIVNVIEVAFRRMYDHGKAREAYLLRDSFISVPSVAAYGPKRKDDLFQLDFVRDLPMATEIGLFYILWLAYARHKPIFTTELQNLELMKGDVITIDLTPIVAGGVGLGNLGDGDLGEGSLGDEAFNGWTAEPILIRAIQHDWATQTIQFTGVDQA